MLMADPNATLLRLSKYGLEPVTIEQTHHVKSLREFFDDPRGFVEAAMGGESSHGHQCCVAQKTMRDKNNWIAASTGRVALQPMKSMNISLAGTRQRLAWR